MLYITKQNFGGKKRDRPMHSHDNLCELLLVYKGFGSYAVEGQSFPIREGDVILANQDEPHEVLSASDAEIGTYCFAFYGLRFAGLPDTACALRACRKITSFRPIALRFAPPERSFIFCGNFAKTRIKILTKGLPEWRWRNASPYRFCCLRKS